MLIGWRGSPLHGRWAVGVRYGVALTDNTYIHEVAALCIFVFLVS